MLFLSQSENFVAFFGNPLPVLVEFTQPFWKDALRWSGLQRKRASRGMTHSSPARELNLPCCSTLPSSQRRQHCCAGSLKKPSFVLQREMNCSHCQSKLKQRFWCKNECAQSLTVHPEPPFRASSQCRRLCQTSLAQWFKCEAFGRYRVHREECLAKKVLVGRRLTVSEGGQKLHRVPIPYAPVSPAISVLLLSPQELFSWLLTVVTPIQTITVDHQIRSILPYFP